MKSSDASGIIFRKRIKEAVYIDYEYGHSLDTVRMFNIPKRTTIRKQSGSNPSMMDPNQNYLRYFLDTEFTQKKTGFLERDGDFSLDLAAYPISRENNADQVCDLPLLTGNLERHQALLTYKPMP